MVSKLYKYQRTAVRALLDLKGRVGVFMEMGTGKTRVTIETIARLRRARRIVVVAPLSAAGVWRREVRKWAPEARTITATHGSIKQRAAKVKDAADRTHKRRVYILVGYESFWREPLRRQILRWAPDVIIYDEAHRLKSWRTRQAKFAHSLGQKNNKIHTPRHIFALTGTPMPNGAQDAFSIFKAIDPDILGSRYTDFEVRYIVKGGYKNYQIIGYKNETEIQDIIAENSFRITKEDALDLPDQVDVVVPVELSKKGRYYYDRMAKDAIVQIESATKKGTALGRIVLSQELRLQQIASGFVRVEEKGEIISFDKSKENALKDLLSDVFVQHPKAVIYCRFRRDVEAACKVAEKLGITVYRLDGTVSLLKREKRIRQFRQTGELAVIVAQIQVASESIDLTAANIAIFYSRNWSLLNYDQARSRVHRHGQKKKVTYYHLIAVDTIDEKIQKGLAKKEDMQAKLLRDKKRAKAFFGG